MYTHGILQDIEKTTLLQTNNPMFGKHHLYHSYHPFHNLTLSLRSLVNHSFEELEFYLHSKEQNVWCVQSNAASDFDCLPMKPWKALFFVFITMAKKWG